MLLCACFLIVNQYSGRHCRVQCWAVTRDGFIVYVLSTQIYCSRAEHNKPVSNTTFMLFSSDRALPVSAAASAQWGASHLRSAPQIVGFLRVHAVSSASAQLNQLQGSDRLWPWSCYRHGTQEPRGNCLFYWYKPDFKQVGTWCKT